MLVDPNVAVTITKACCVLHNFVRRRDDEENNHEDIQNNPMESIVERVGVINSQTSAKDVRKYFVAYFNDPNHALSWQNKIIGI